MKFNVEEFRSWEHKCITLLGMSGVGKTRLALMLREHNWFHYSGDYRIGTRYLDEPILDNIKQQAMQVPFLKELLRSDSIYIANNISVDNLKPVSSFLGKLGDPAQGGLSFKEFKRRQELHRLAEIAAMKDVPEFIRKAKELYGYQHFVNDAGGSICDLGDPQVSRVLKKHTLILYIKASEQDEKNLIRRERNCPKPLYYQEPFLDRQLDIYMKKKNLPFVAMIDPDEFVRWMFPKLLHSRQPLYEAFAGEYGYTVTTDELATVREEADFVRLLEQAVARGS